jgi:addiction module HigA family antidote
MSLTDPSHPGLSVRDSMEAMGWTVTGCAVQLGVSRNTMSRLINGRCGISPAMALALERIGWSNAEFWMRRQAQYDLAQERRRSVGV